MPTVTQQRVAPTSRRREIMISEFGGRKPKREPHPPALIWHEMGHGPTACHKTPPIVARSGPLTHCYQTAILDRVEVTISAAGSGRDPDRLRSAPQENIQRLRLGRVGTIRRPSDPAAGVRPERTVVSNGPTSRGPNRESCTVSCSFSLLVAAGDATVTRARGIERVRARSYKPVPVKCVASLATNESGTATLSPLVPPRGGREAFLFSPLLVLTRLRRN